jgi:hypothetical protein
LFADTRNCHVTQVVGRFIVGFAVCLSASAECVYISEISPPVSNNQSNVNKNENVVGTLLPASDPSVINNHVMKRTDQSIFVSRDMQSLHTAVSPLGVSDKSLILRSVPPGARAVRICAVLVIAAVAAVTPARLSATTSCRQHVYGADIAD